MNQNSNRCQSVRSHAHVAAGWTGLSLSVIACGGLLLGGPLLLGDDWLRFRGPNGSGLSSLQGVPTHWTDEDYEWKIDLPGEGHSSPVIHGERLFVASGKDDGTRLLLCLNATTGEILWTQAVQLEPEPHVSDRNSYGSSTPLVDDERVYIAFADKDRYLFSAYDHAGTPLWTKELGPFISMHGQGHSPVLFGELVILANDQAGPSFVIALDRKTGQEAWRSPRIYRRAAYSTPLVLEVPDQKPQLICVSGATGIAGLDLETGAELWASGELPERTVSSPVYGEGVVVVTCGSGGRGHTMVAVEPSFDPEIRTPNIRWTRTKSLPYVPTPIISNGILYLWADDGVVMSADLQTGEIIERLRVGGNYYSSPVLINGKLYCPADDGEIAVVSTHPKLELLGKSPLGDQIHSTPAVGNGRVYFRGFHTLSCLKAQ